jgi:uncharacterized protein (DUF2132 family)
MTDQRNKGTGDASPWVNARSVLGNVALTEGASATASARRQDPMHGVTLKMIVTRLEQHYGWEELGQRIAVNCFLHDPSVSSSLKFLRRTPWARAKVEALYRQTTVLHALETGSASGNAREP